MASPKEGFSLHVNLFIGPEDVSKFFEVFTPVYEKVIAEPACTFFEVYQNPNSPGEICWVENWSKSEQWFNENIFSKDYLQNYIAVTKSMYIKPLERRIYSHVPGMSTLAKHD